MGHRKEAEGLNCEKLSFPPRGNGTKALPGLSRTPCHGCLPVTRVTRHFPVGEPPLSLEETFPGQQSRPWATQGGTMSAPRPSLEPGPQETWNTAVGPRGPSRSSSGWGGRDPARAAPKGANTSAAREPKAQRTSVRLARGHRHTHSGTTSRSVAEGRERDGKERHPCKGVTA